MMERVFFVLAILSLATTSVLSYGYFGYPTRRDTGLRQVRRCPTCPADCPESLSESPWYQSPTVYGQPISFNSNNRNYDQRSSASTFAGSRNFHQRTPSSNYDNRSPSIDANSYVNPFSGELNSYGKPCSSCRCPYASCNSRYARSEDIAVSPEIEDGSVATYSSAESRGFPYNFLNSFHSQIPESYREFVRASGILNPFDAQTIRVSRHYGNTYDDSPIGDEYKKSKNFIYDDRLKAIETPSQERVYVVYRADADRIENEESLDSMPMMTSAEQRKLESSGGFTTNPISDSQLEEVVRRAIAAASRDSRREDAIYGRSIEALRDVRYNEHRREGDENSYNPRRPYNDAIYQRFNPDESIDRLEKSRKIYRDDFRTLEVSHEPEVSFDSTYDMPLLETTIPNRSGEEEIVRAQSRENIEYNVEPEVTGWEDDLGVPEENFEKTIDVEDNEKESFSSIEKEIGEDETEEQETYEEPEVKLPLTNYRTQSRSDEKILSKTNDEDARTIEEVTTIPTTMEKTMDYVERLLREADPDLATEIENPPTVTESALRLNFESLDASTPPPNN